MVGVVGLDIPAGKDYDLVIDNALISANLTDFQRYLQLLFLEKVIYKKSQKAHYQQQTKVEGFRVTRI